MTAPTDIAPADEAAILALNNAFATELSPLDLARLHALVATATYARHVDRAAFLIALDQDAAYDNPNFAWFRARHPRFVYVDRLAVDPAARNRGNARLLYADLIARAEAAGHALIGCEVNLDPPNPTSDALHAALGFIAVGSARIGAKTVRYLTRALTRA